MPIDRKIKIAVILTGGTIDAERFTRFPDQTGIMPENEFRPDNFSRVKFYLLWLLENNRNVFENFEFDFIENPEMSKFIDDDDIDKMSHKALRHDCDAAIITCGTDVAADVKQKMSDFIRNNEKPFILTGSMVPLSHGTPDIVESRLDFTENQYEMISLIKSESEFRKATMRKEIIEAYDHRGKYYGSDSFANLNNSITELLKYFRPELREKKAEKAKIAKGVNYIMHGKVYTQNQRIIKNLDLKKFTEESDILQ